MQELNFEDDSYRSIRSEQHLAWLAEMAEERKLEMLAECELEESDDE